MKKYLLMAAVAMMAATNAFAQKIEVVDADGYGIPLVSVLTEDGNLIGTTDLNGILADVKGAKKVALSHLAYKSQLVTVATLKEGRVTMEDLGYDIDEIVVKPKPYVYKEYYYRFFRYIGDSLRAYSAGIYPVVYDIRNNYKPKTRNLFSYGTIANKASRWHGSVGKVRVRELLQNDNFQRIEVWMKDKKLQARYHTSFVNAGPNLWRVEIPGRRKVGQIVHSGGQTRATLDVGQLEQYAYGAKGR